MPNSKIAFCNNYYQYDRGGGDGDDICGDSRFFSFF